MIYRIALSTLVAGGLALLAGCSPLATLNRLTPDDSLRSTDIAYGESPRQRLDIYRPDSAGNGTHPVVVFFYGGSWKSGSRADYAFVGEALAKRGIVTVIADYRLYPEVRFPDFLRDSAAAVAWAHANAARFGGDPQRLFVMGHSAGGYNAAMIALDARWLAPHGLSPRALAGWIGLAGPYDFLPIENPAVKPVFFHPAYPPGTQPIAFASASAPRTFLAAAPRDALVDPERNAAQLAQRLQTLGVAVTFKTYERTSHALLIGAFAPALSFLAPVADDVAAFVKKD